MFKKYQELQGASSIDHVVKIVTRARFHSREEYAANYALYCAHEQDDTSEENIGAHLSILEEERPRNHLFAFAEALEIAIKMRDDNYNQE